MKIGPAHEEHEPHLFLNSTHVALPREWHCPSPAMPSYPGTENNCIAVLHALLHLLPGDQGIADKKRKKVILTVLF